MTLVFAGSLSMNQAQAATGDILQDYPNTCGFGIAFDGTTLWCTKTGGIGSNEILKFRASDGFFTGAIITSSSSTVVSLAYDNNSDVLWGNVLGQPTNTLVKIDPSNGDILDTIVTTVPHVVNSWSDGLSYDEVTDTLWMSPEDAGVNRNVYEIDPSNGSILQTLNFPSSEWSGIAATGDSIWMDDKGSTMHQFDMTGVPITTFNKVANSEDLAYDDQTFAPKCAIWAALTMIAYEVPCATEIVCDEYNSVEICKIADIRDDGDNIYRVGEVIEFDFAIVVHTSSTTLIDVEVKDRLGGDLMSFEDSLVSTDSLTCTLGNPINNGGHEKGGKTEKEFLDCTAEPNGELEPNSWEEITFSVKTDVNPGQQKQESKGKTPKNEYTSCGVHEINSGASMQFWWFGQNPETDEPTELKTPSISVDVFDASYPDSDCDKDGIDDPVDLCPFEGLEVTGYVDVNGCPVDP